MPLLCNLLLSKMITGATTTFLPSRTYKVTMRFGEEVYNVHEVRGIEKYLINGPIEEYPDPPPFRSIQNLR